jgi:hypothetical protein
LQAELYKRAHQINLTFNKQNSAGKISFTIDTWTSPNAISFLGITGHWIDLDWQLKSLTLDFVKLAGPHSGDNIADAFISCIRELGITTKVKKGGTCHQVGVLREVLKQNRFCWLFIFA